LTPSELDWVERVISQPKRPSKTSKQQMALVAAKRQRRTGHPRWLRLDATALRHSFRHSRDGISAGLALRTSIVTSTPAAA